MLIQFSVENLLSFKERTSFSMVAGKERLKIDHKNKKVNSICTLKLATIFGANASGKSNLIKAIDFGRGLVLDNFKLGHKHGKKFKLCQNPAKLSSIEYRIQHKNHSYIYGFSFDNIKIHEEWLYLLKNAKGDAEQIFDRFLNINDSFDIELGKFFPVKDKKNTTRLFSSFKSELLLINLVDQFSFESESTGFSHMRNVYDWFENALTVIYPQSKGTSGIHHELDNNENFRKVFAQFLKALDTGIDQISFKDVKKENLSFPEEILNKIVKDLLKKGSEKTSVSISDVSRGELIIVKKVDNEKVKYQKLITQRKIHGTEQLVDFDSTDEESDGTKRLFDLIPIILSSIKGNNVVLVDEIERSLHPNLVQTLIHIYLDHSQECPSQLILATHESALLDQELLRRDEIWFISKDSIGASKIHSLSEYNERFDKELRKSYLNGRFNGIPKLNRIEEVIIGA